MKGFIWIGFDRNIDCIYKSAELRTAIRRQKKAIFRENSCRQIKLKNCRKALCVHQALLLKFVKIKALKLQLNFMKKKKSTIIFPDVSFDANCIPDII